MTAPVPARAKIANRRQTYRSKCVLKLHGVEVGFYVEVGADRAGAPPGEIFLRPRGPFGGSVWGIESEFVGKSLSIHMQHGYSLAQLYRTFNRGSMGKAALAEALLLAWEKGLRLDAESQRLAELFTVRRAERPQGAAIDFAEFVHGEATI
jgi:hypothetical protein